MQEVCNFAPEVKLDLEKFVLGGHSFGGLTSIAVASEDPRVKAVFGFDAFLWPIIDELKSDKLVLNQPHMHIVTEGFEPRVEHYFEYSTAEELKTMIQKGQNSEKCQMVILKHANHYH